MQARRKVNRVGSKYALTWARAIVVAGPVMLFAASMIAACTDDATNGERAGLQGDSCSRTADCTDPLRCMDNICTEPPSTSDGGLPDGFGPGPGPSASEGPWSECDQCMEMTCAAEEAACGAECQAIEGCIETACAHLSSIGSSDEGGCFVQCQNRFPGGKDQHLALVNCAQTKTTNCQPPCTFYPQDYDLCRAFMNNGDCYGYKGACDANPNCKNYRDCVGICSSLSECLACDDSAGGAEGRVMLEAYETCVASECITESWMP